MTSYLFQPQKAKRVANLANDPSNKKAKTGRGTFVPRDDKSRDRFNALVCVSETTQQTIQSIKFLMADNRQDSDMPSNCMGVIPRASGSSAAPKSSASGKPVKAYFILGKILSLLDDPKDLRSAIRASPTLLAAFQTSPRAQNKMMTHIIVKAIQVGAMDAALGLLYCPHFEIGDERPCRRDLSVPAPEQSSLPQPKMSKWEAKVGKFLHQFKNRSFEFPDEHVDIVRLYRNYSRINKILPYFVDSMLNPVRRPKLISTTTAARSAAKLARHNLSDYELCRLQRALFNYEIYCRLVDPRAVQAGVPLPGHLANLSLPKHEGEEVRTLRTFIVNQYRLVFGELDVAFSQYLQAQVRRDTRQPEVQRHNADILVWEHLKSFPWLEQLYRGSQRDAAEDAGREYQPLSGVPEYVDVLARLGLRFFNHFTQIPAAIRGDFIKETMYPIISLDRLPFKLCITGTSATPMDPWSTQPNRAWEEVIKAGGADIEERHALRKHGWVFWDVQRLMEKRLLTSDQLFDKAATPDDTYYRARDRSHIPGLSEAFRRLFFTVRIKKEWGATVTETQRAQRMAVDWLSQIQASAPVEQAEWYRELTILRSSKTPRL